MESREEAIELTIRPAPWSADAERLIATALQHATPAEIRRQVEAGIAELYQVMRGDRIGAVFVLRVDHDADGSEGVIVAAAGGVRGVDLTGAVLPHIERMFINCRAVRIHTARPGLARKLGQAGYRAAEIVLKKGLQ